MNKKTLLPILICLYLLSTTFLYTALADDTTPPTCEGMTVSNQDADQDVTIALVVNDDVGVDKIIPSWNNSGVWANQTAITGSGTSYNATFNGTWTPDITAVISVIFYFNDTSNNWDLSAQYNYDLEDVTAPGFVIEEFETNTTDTSADCLFTYTAYDAACELSHRVFSTNNTGTWTNASAAAFVRNDICTATSTTTLNDTAGYVVSWMIYANDTSGNWAASEIQNFTLTGVESTPTPGTSPLIIDGSTTPAPTGGFILDGFTLGFSVPTWLIILLIGFAVFTLLLLFSSKK